MKKVAESPPELVATVCVANDNSPLKLNITHRTVQNKKFRFSNSQKSWGEMVFHGDGTVGDYSHPNERFWRVRANAVELLNQDKFVSARFDFAAYLENGKYHFEGEFSPDPNIHHFLDEI